MIAPFPRPIRALFGFSLAVVREGMKQNAESLDRLVARAASAVARRMRLTDDERQELESKLWVRLLDQDARALNNLRSDAGMPAYLYLTAKNLVLDEWTARDGKWRPSARTREAGPAAVALERALDRDELTLDQAFEALAPRFPRSELVEAAERLQSGRRPRRRFVSLEVLVENGQEPAACPHRTVENCQDRLQRALADAMRMLPIEDRRLVEMRYFEGRQVSWISRQIGADQKRLYRRFGEVLGRLRRALEVQGATLDDFVAVAE